MAWLCREWGDKNSMNKVTISVELNAFTVPDHVTAVPPPTPPGRPEPRGSQRRLDIVKYPLSALDATTLEALCEEFTDAVFAKAGIQRPPKPA